MSLVGSTTRLGTMNERPPRGRSGRILGAKAYQNCTSIPGDLRLLDALRDHASNVRTPVVSDSAVR